MDWLLSPIDPARAHEVSFAISWHARMMVLAWGMLAPAAVLIARFFKVLPGQDWPNELDNQVWWHTHWLSHTLVLGFSVAALVLVLPLDFAALSLHNALGSLVFVLLVVQVLLGVFRGSKGGPTDLATDGSVHGDHYDMTPRRKAFEAMHKTLGYAVLGLALVAILLGLWQANGPIWMWLALFLWWSFLGFCFVRLQKRGLAIDTYQAIWGDDPAHPGNQLPQPGWGVRRLGDSSNTTQEESDTVGEIAPRRKV